MAREYEAFCVENAAGLKREMNRLSQEGWKRIRYTEGDTTPVFTVTASRKYQTCAHEDCEVRLYRGETTCNMHFTRWGLEWSELFSRRTNAENCVVSGCYEYSEMPFYCDDCAQAAAANYALKGKASE